MNGHNSCVELLLQHGAHADASDEGRTPLHCAVEFGHEDVVLTLLKYGASVHAVCKRNMAPLHLAVVSSSKRSQIISLLLRHGADVNVVARDHAESEPSRTFGVTCLMLAAHQNDIEATKVLLEAGAKIMLRPNLRTAHDVAVDFGHNEIVALFEEAIRLRLRTFLMGRLRRGRGGSLVLMLPVDVLGLIASHTCSFTRWIDL
eukprot:c13733_g1_i3.p1 GENE.c13733_g1_i3~~c13733_g1_i3.p1  ORF type:complete len:203 (+),score=30.77 c13733_g1_i3:38-646(+)